MNTIFLRPVLHGGLLWLLFLFSAATGAAPTITWTPPSVTQKVATGQTITVPVKFTASENISNALVRVVPTLAPFVVTNPSSFPSIPKGQTVTLTLTISAAASSPIGTFDGTIQLKSGGKTNATFAKPLPVTISVVQGDASFSTLPDPKKVISDPEGGVYPVNQVLINLIDEATRYDADQIANNVGGKVIGYFPSANMYQLQVPADTITQLRAIITTLELDPRVESAFTNNSVSFNAVESDLAHLKDTGCKLLRNEPCTIAYDNIKVQNAWDIIEEKKPPLFKVIVGIVDKNVDTSHPEFSGVTYDYDTDDVSLSLDFSHGTAVAGIIGANNISASLPYISPQMNGILSGIPGLDYLLVIRPMRTIDVDLSTFPFIFFATTTDQLEKVIEKKSQVVNLSVGSTNCAGIPLIYQIKNFCTWSISFDKAKKAYSQLFSKHEDKVLFVAGAGNGYVKFDGTHVGINAVYNIPGGGISAVNLITVGAATTSDPAKKTDFSNYGTGVDIAAPGENVYAPTNFNAPPDINDYQAFRGTSASAPMVTGVAGLIKAIKGEELTPAQLKQILKETGNPFSTDQQIGKRLDARAAVCHRDVLDCPTTGFFGNTVSANYEWPNIGSVLYPSGTAIAGTGIEFSSVGGGIMVDFTDTGFRITYVVGWLFNNTTPKTFDGLVISVLSGTPHITGVSLGSTNIVGYNATQLSFDDTHVYVNQLGFSSFPAGSFIDVNVGFGNPPVVN